jgi:hypothetical protein
MDTRFSLADYPREPLTVRRKLILLGAYCKNGKIFDRWGKEIYFYQVLEPGGVCAVQPLWAFKARPPSGAIEAPTNSHEEEDRLKSLEKRYRVIKMYSPDLPCSPSGCESALAN